MDNCHSDQSATERDDREEEFQGWKEIAAFLGVSVRRAQQWEKELGLPVQRFDTGSRGRVLATRGSIERWRRQRTKGATEGAASDSGQPPAPAPAGRERPRSSTERSEALPGAATEQIHTWWRRGVSRRLVLCLVTVAIAFGLPAWFLSRHRSPAPTTALVVGGELHVLDGVGGTLWRKTFAEGPATPPLQPVPPERVGIAWRTNTTLVQDVDGDDRKEVLFVFNPPLGQGVGPGSRLICYEGNGTERWRYVPGRRVRWRDRRFDPTYMISWVFGPVPVEGRPHLLVSASNNFFPCQISLLDATTGRLVGEYWHLGGLGTGVVLDADGDGRLEAVVGGVNNPGPGNGLPALVELRLPLPRPRPDVEAVFDQAPAQEVAYLLFPPIDAFVVDPYPARIGWIHLDGWGGLELSISQGPLFDRRGQVFFTLKRDLSVVDSRPCDLLTSYHEELYRQKKLDHRLYDREVASWRNVRRFRTMPDANSAEVQALTSRRN